NGTIIRFARPFVITKSLSRWTQEVKADWKKYRPKMYRALERVGSWTCTLRKRRRARTRDHKPMETGPEWAGALPFLQDLTLTCLVAGQSLTREKGGPMPSEIIGEFGTPGASSEWIEAEGKLAIKHIVKICGAPPPEMNLEVIWQEHELGLYPVIGL